MHKYRNEIIYTNLRQESLTNKIEKKKLNWFEHLQRMNEEQIKRYLQENTQRKKEVGRPRKFKKKQ